MAVFVANVCVGNIVVVVVVVVRVAPEAAAEPANIVPVESHSRLFELGLV